MVNIFYLIRKPACKKTGSQRVREMSRKKSGNRRVLIKKYFWQFWNRKKDHKYLLFDSKTGLQKNWKPESKRNVPQKVWKPESTNTVICLTILESKERSINIFYLIRKPACKKVGSQRVRKMSRKKSGSRRKAKLLKCLKPKERSISSIWSEKRPAKNLEAGEYQYKYSNIVEHFGIERKSISFIWSEKRPAKNLEAGEYQYKCSNIVEHFGIERKSISFIWSE